MEQVHTTVQKMKVERDKLVDCLKGMLVFWLYWDM